MRFAKHNNFEPSFHNEIVTSDCAKAYHHLETRYLFQCHQIPIMNNFFRIFSQYCISLFASSSYWDVLIFLPFTLTINRDQNCSTFDPPSSDINSIVFTFY